MLGLGNDSFSSFSSSTTGIIPHSWNVILDKMTRVVEKSGKIHHTLALNNIIFDSLVITHTQIFFFDTYKRRDPRAVDTKVP